MRGARQCGSSIVRWAQCVALLLMALALPAAAQIELGNDPQMIHLACTADPATSMTFVWVTSGYDNPNEVRMGETAEYELGAFRGASLPSPLGRGVVHWATAEQLAPGTEYHYTLSPDAGGEWSPDAVFRTAPADFDTPLVLLAAGDSRQALPWPLGNLERWEALVSLMAQEPAELVIFGGDLVFDGITQPFWFDWLIKAEPLTRTRPLMPCPGNHEYGGDPEARAYQAFFELPRESGTEFWYSVDYGACHVISLNSETSGDAEQLAWLEADLEYASGAGFPWIIVILHRPLYTSGNGLSSHGPDGTARALWTPLFDRYGVDLVIAGHNHFHQRSYPLFGGEDPDNPRITDHETTHYYRPGGTIHVVSGAAGAPTFGYDPDNEPGHFVTWIGQTDEYMRLSVDGGRRLHAETISVDGELIDEFWIYEDWPSPTPGPSATPGPSPTPGPTLPATPRPTATPSPVPTATPSPTPTTGPPRVRIETNRAFYTAGDPFLLTLKLFNPGPERAVDLYVLLEVSGVYWFWPSWTRNVDFQSRTLPAGYYRSETLLSFTWPQGAGARDGLRFWAALVAPGTADLIDLDAVTWAFR